MAPTLSGRRLPGDARILDTAGGLAFMDGLTIGGRPVTGIRLSGAVVAVIAGIIISLPLPFATRSARPTVPAP